MYTRLHPGYICVYTIAPGVYSCIGYYDKDLLSYTVSIADRNEGSDDQTVYVEASGVGQIEDKVNYVLQGIALESDSATQNLITNFNV